MLACTAWAKVIVQVKGGGGTAQLTQQQHLRHRHGLVYLCLLDCLCIHTGSKSHWEPVQQSVSALDRDSWYVGSNSNSAVETQWGGKEGKLLLEHITYLKDPIKVAISRKKLGSILKQQQSLIGLIGNNSWFNMAFKKRFCIVHVDCSSIQGCPPPFTFLDGIATS